MDMNEIEIKATDGGKTEESKKKKREKLQCEQSQYNTI